MSSQETRQQQDQEQQQQQSKSWLGSFFGYIGAKIQSWLSPCPVDPNLTLVMYEGVDGEGDNFFLEDVIAYDGVHKDEKYFYNSSKTLGRTSIDNDSSSSSSSSSTDDGGSHCDKDSEKISKKRTPKFLGRYSEDEIRKLFEEFKFDNGQNIGMNFNQLFTKLGFDPNKFIFKIDDKEFTHRIDMYYIQPICDNLVAQLGIQNTTKFDVMRSKLINSSKTTGGTAMSWPPSFYIKGFADGSEYFRRFQFQPKPSTNDTSLDVVNIDWLRFQNPLKKGEAQNYLPGQLSPSLGIITEMHLLLEDLCKKHNRDGVMNTPEYFYNAFIYSKFPRWPYKFLNPAFEGFFQSLKLAISPLIREYGFPKIAWAMNISAIKCAVVDSLEAARAFNPLNGTAESITVKWETQEQAYAMTSRFVNYFESPGYKKMVEKYTIPNIFSLDINVINGFLKI